jgi:hypothetical protein
MRGFETLKPVTMMTVAFRDMTSRSLLDRYECFEKPVLPPSSRQKTLVREPFMRICSLTEKEACLLFRLSPEHVKTFQSVSSHRLSTFSTNHKLEVTCL